MTFQGILTGVLHISLYLCVHHVTCPVHAVTYSEGCYVTSYNQQCFKAIKDDENSRLKGLREALSYCASVGDNYSLLTVSDAEVHNAVVEFLLDHELISDDVWLAMNRTTTGQWYNVNGSLYTAGSSIFAPTVNLTSAYMNFDGSTPAMLDADVATDKKRFICQFKGSVCSQFRTNTTGYKSTADGCYVVFPREQPRAELAWYSARSVCLRYGGDLAGPGVVSVAGRDWIPVTSSTNEAETQFWVGINRDPLIWINTRGEVQQPVIYSRFIDGAPRAYDAATTCISMVYSSLWVWTVRPSCTEVLLFVCQKSLPLINVPPTTTTSTSTLFNGSTKADKKDLSDGAIGGIVAGCAVFYIVSVVIAVVCGCCCRCCNTQQKAEKNSNSNNNNNNKNKDKDKNRNTPINAYEPEPVSATAPAPALGGGDDDDGGNGYMQPNEYMPNEYNAAGDGAGPGLGINAMALQAHVNRVRHQNEDQRGRDEEYCNAEDLRRYNNHHHQQQQQQQQPHNYINLSTLPDEQRSDRMYDDVGHTAQRRW